MSRSNLYASILNVPNTNYVPVFTFNYLTEDIRKQKSALESNNHSRFVLFLKMNDVKWAIVATIDKFWIRSDELYSMANHALAVEAFIDE